MCLKYIDASMYQVARSLILPFTVVFQYVFLRKPSSMAVLLCCAVIFAGFLTGLFGDGSNPQALIGEIKGEDDDDDDDDNPASTGASMSGIIFGVLSSLSTALHAVVIKSSLEAVQGNTLELVWYNNVLTAVALAPLVLAAGEYDQIQTLLFPPEDDPAYWNGSSYALWHTLCIGTLVTGFFGFLINLAGFLQIKVTSPVTHMISSAVRGVLQTIIAVWIFSEVLTAPRVLGILFILTGSAFYTFVKSTG
jgi:GDP-fucose transporter C1